MSQYRDRLANNQASWAFANDQFNRRKGDYAEAIRRGRNLPSQVLDALALSGTERILHLLCNDGREAAALSFHAGAHVVGVDFSEEAVRFARDLNVSLSLTNDFVAAEAYSFLEQGPTNWYDRILVTPGSIRWLPDLRRFFELCINWLSPSGLLTVWDFHPLRLCLDDDRRLINSYPLSPRSYEREGIRDYAARRKDYVLFDRCADASQPFKNPHSVYVTEYGLSNVVEAALADHEVRLTRFTELGFSWEQRCFTWHESDAQGVFAAPAGFPAIPLTFLLQIQRDV